MLEQFAQEQDNTFATQLKDQMNLMQQKIDNRGRYCGGGKESQEY